MFNLKTWVCEECGRKGKNLKRYKRHVEQHYQESKSQLIKLLAEYEAHEVLKKQVYEEFQTRAEELKRKAIYYDAVLSI